MQPLLTKRSLKQINAVRLSEGEHPELEFSVVLSATNKTDWISATSISNPTLRSSLFQQFFQSINDSITNVDQLTAHLMEASSGNKSRKQCRPGQALVTVDFGGETAVFEEKALKQLSFFRNMLSERWTNNNNNNNSSSSDATDAVNTRPVKIFGNISSKSDVQKPFTAKNLQTLLKCFETGCIPRDLSLDADSLDCLINCCDYLTSNDDNFVINQQTVLDYLKNCRPSLDHSKREKLLATTKNATVKNAITEWNQQLSSLMNEHRKHLASNHRGLKLSDAKLDGITSNALFIEKFKVSITVKPHRLKIKINACDSSDEKAFENLWAGRTYEDNYDILTKSSIPKLIGAIISNKSMCIRIEDSHRDLIGTIFDGIEEDLMDGIIDSEAPAIRERATLRLVDVMIAAMRLEYESCSNYDYPLSVAQHFHHLNGKDKTKFLKFVLDNHEFYASSYVIYDEAEELCAWFGMIKQMIENCEQDVIIDTAQKWFPILHQNHPSLYTTNSSTHKKQVESNDDWIWDSVVSKLGGQQSFEFALYLSNYFVFDRSTEEPFPQKFLDLLKSHLGVEWTLVPPTDSVGDDSEDSEAEGEESD